MARLSLLFALALAKKSKSKKEQKQKQFQWTCLIFVPANGLLVVLLSFISYFLPYVKKKNRIFVQFVHILAL